MGETRLIYSIEDLDKASDEMLRAIDKAVLATAFKLRDDMRSEFTKSRSQYKYGTSRYDDLAQGIMIGKLQDCHVKIHALGDKNLYDTYKTRFFVGGTIFRKQTKRNSQSIKPYSKGRIKENDAVQKGMQSAESTLSQYIRHAIE